MLDTVLSRGNLSTISSPGTLTPRLPRRSTNMDGWYRSISREMGHPRSPTPILKNRGDSLSRAASQTSINSYKHDLRAQSPPLSNPRPYSPYLMPEYNRNRSMSPARSASPKHEKSVVIGPVTDMVTNERQEYYKHRDAQTGKVRLRFASAGATSNSSRCAPARSCVIPRAISYTPLILCTASGWKTWLYDLLVAVRTRQDQ